MIDRVKVGGVTYTVEDVAGLAHDHNLYGQCIGDKLHIKIDAESPVGRKHQTFVHELLHATFIEAGYNDHDEETVNRIALVLHQVLRDNDFGWLREEVADE